MYAYIYDKRVTTGGSSSRVASVCWEGTRSGRKPHCAISSSETWRSSSCCCMICRCNCSRFMRSCFWRLSVKYNWPVISHKFYEGSILKFTRMHNFFWNFHLVMKMSMKNMSRRSMSWNWSLYKLIFVWDIIERGEWRNGKKFHRLDDLRIIMWHLWESFFWHCFRTR